MPRGTTHSGAGQAVPAHNHACECEHATDLLHLDLASSTNNSSRDQQTSLPFGKRHTHNAAPPPLACGGESLAHWHAAQAPSNETLDPHTLSWTHAFFP